MCPTAYSAREIEQLSAHYAAACDRVLGVRTMYTTQFCNSAPFKVTVWNTVHELLFKKKKEYKIKKKIVYDLIYGMFILHYI